MKKHAYWFNPHTLKYEKVVVGFRDKLAHISFSVLFGVVLGVVLLIIGFHFFDTPDERALRREVAMYRSRIDDINRRIDRDNRVLNDLQQRDDNIYRLIFQAEPMKKPAFPYRHQSNDESKTLIETTSQRLDTLSYRLYVLSRSFDEVFQMAANKQERLSSMPAIMPIAKNQCQIVSGFGYRFHPILHTRRMHTGIDMSARMGTPVYATGDGVVDVAGSNISEFSGYGTLCVIDHGFGFKTLYGHLKDVKVRKGQHVKRGELIGHVGATGLAQASHLHYEVFQNGERVNPVYFFFNDLSPDEYEEVIQAANQENQCLS